MSSSSSSGPSGISPSSFLFGAIITALGLVLAVAGCLLSARRHHMIRRQLVANGMAGSIGGMGLGIGGLRGGSLDERGRPREPPKMAEVWVPGSDEEDGGNGKGKGKREKLKQSAVWATIEKVGYGPRLFRNACD
jgi:hypothetical protein